MAFPQQLIAIIKVVFPTVTRKCSEKDDKELCRTRDTCTEPVFSLLKHSCGFLHRQEFEQALCSCQIVIDLSWEKINTGYWKDVDVEWRKTYYLASILKTISLYGVGRIVDSMKSCDMGLLMGTPLFNNILVVLASHIHKQIITMHDRTITGTIYHDDTTKKPRLTEHKSTIARVHCPSLETFKNSFMSKQQPVIIQGIMDEWPSMTTRRWSFPYLKEIAGYRTVPVEIGSRYTDETWTQKLITINEFVDNYITSDKPNMPKAYLAQHQLFDQIPTLASDVQVPDYCCLGDSDDVVMNAWFGPAGTVSPLHHDPSHNLLAQVVGQKYIRLYSPTETEKLYPHNSYLLCNTSQVDLEKPDLVQFPRFQTAVHHECILNPGDMLYIPPKHWHFVKSLSLSFSVSFWWN